MVNNLSWTLLVMASVLLLFIPSSLQFSNTFRENYNLRTKNESCSTSKDYSPSLLGLDDARPSSSRKRRVVTQSLLNMVEQKYVKEAKVKSDNSIQLEDPSPDGKNPKVNPSIISSPEVSPDKKAVEEEDIKIHVYDDQVPTKSPKVKLFPKVESFTISHGWTNDRIDRLSCAVKVVIEANPILTSRASISNQDGTIYAHPGAFPLSEHNFLNIINVSNKVPTTLTFDEENYHENIDFITNVIAPLVKKEEGGAGVDEIRNKSSLFSVTLFVLNKTHVCYHMAMSHLIGDGTTYYLLMEQLSFALNGKDFEPINWENQALIPHRMYPENCSERDIFRISGLPFMIGVFSGIPSMSFRKTRSLIFNMDAINAKKRDLLRKGKHDFLSSNDIIMTALCKIAKPAVLMSMIMNRRMENPNIGSRDGGNCFKFIFFDKEAGLDPNGIRQIVKDGNFFRTNEIPLLPFIQSKICYVTSWASITKYLEGDDVQTICHIAGPTFLETSTNMAIIFQVSPNRTAVTFNYPIDSLQLMNDSFLKDILHS